MPGRVHRPYRGRRQREKGARNLREYKGRLLAARADMAWDGECWHVPSEKGAAVYLVRIDGENAPACSCPDFEVHGERCKHLFAVEYHVRQRALWEEERFEAAQQPPTSAIFVFPQRPERPKGDVSKSQPKGEPEDGPEGEPRPKRATYRQDWPAYNLAQTREKADFQRLLADLCACVQQPERQKGKAGRPRVLVRDMIFCAAFKVYGTVSARRFMSDLADAHTKGYVARVPHYNTIFKYLEMPELTPVLRALVERSAMPMRAIESRFAVDSTGFSTCQYVRWFDHKYGVEKEAHEWLKVHVMCGVTTNVITSVEITHKDGNDCPEFTTLLADTARRFEIAEVSADKAYLSRGNLEAVDALGAVAFIPFKVNSTEGRGSAVWTRLYHYYQFHHDAFLDHYHRRSLVESTFSMMQAKFGSAIRSKTRTAQINELLCKVLCHNICCVIQSMYELGIAAVFGD